MASPVTSAWAATAALMRSGDRVADAQLALAEVDHLDVDGALGAGEIGLRLGALLLVAVQQLVALGLQRGGRPVAHGGQLAGLTARHREVAHGPAERPLGPVDARARRQRQCLREPALRLAVDVADLVAAVLLAGRLGLALGLRVPVARG